MGTRWRHGRARRSRHGFTRVRSRVLPPPWGRAAHRERVPTREVSEDASVFRGALLFFPRLAFCTVIRRAFCIVPVQASGIFGQVPLSPAPVIPSCVYHAARAGALIHLQLRTRLSPLLNYLARDSSLTLSPLSLSTSLSSSPLPSVSPSQRTLTPEHARLILLRHRRAGSIEDTHFLASFFTLPPSPWVLLHVRHRPHRNPSL